MPINVAVIGAGSWGTTVAALAAVNTPTILWARRAELAARTGAASKIAARRIDGYRGAELFVREVGSEVEFVTLLRFDSMDAVAEFAGPEASKPVIFPKAEALITRMEQARHYRVAIGK